MLTLGDVHEIPEGFARLELGGGFSAALGPVYLCRAKKTLGFRVLAAHANPVGTCHGGALATFADLQIAALMVGTENGGPHRATISLSLDYVAPIPVGAWVEAEVSLVKQTNSLVFTSALITWNHTPVARTNAIYRNGSRPKDTQPP